MLHELVRVGGRVGIEHIVVFIVQVGLLHLILVVEQVPVVELLGVEIRWGLELGGFVLPYQLVLVLALNLPVAFLITAGLDMNSGDIVHG